MTDNENILPIPPTAEELAAEEAAAARLDLSRNWLDYTQSFPEPRYLLEYGGTPFAPLGGIQAITGHQKNGKTFLMAQLMAAVLCGGSEKMRAHLPSLQLHAATAESLQRPPVVLYVDTEMEMLNTVKVVRRVQYLCEWPFDQTNPQLRVLWLRAEESNAMRWAKTKQAIAEVQPTAIFLDGIRDVIGDFNDNAESANLISECMALATNLDCCLFTVLHENPGSDKMRGHLGTELSNKVTDTFRCTKQKVNNVVTFTVKQVDARGKDVDDWTFEIIDDAGGLGVPRITAAPAPEEESGKKLPTMSDAEWNMIVESIKDVIQPPRGVYFTDLKEGLKDKLGVGSRKATEWINRAEELGVIVKSSKKFVFNGINNQDNKTEEGLLF